MIRSFLAIELPRAILKRIEEVQDELRQSLSDVRWVNPEKIHLTLKFFGNIEEGRIEPIVKSIEELIHATSPFHLILRGVGAFPHLKNPRVIWMGLREGEEALTSFQKQLEIQLKNIGIQPEDRPFHPHLTLGRMRSHKGKEDLLTRMEKYKEESFGDIHVERVVLFKSDLRPTGPIYTPLKEIKLGGRSTE